MTTTPSTTAPAALPDADPVATAAASGVGARITLAVMTDDFPRVITAALAAVDSGDLLVETDRVSTFVRGAEPRIAEYLRDLVAAAAAEGHHVAATLLLSRGCPGEVCGVMPTTTVPALRLAPSGVAVQAQWSLYPLLDAVAADGAGPTDHLAPVWAAIERARERGTFLRADHFVTTLAGDLSDVLATVVACWLEVGRTVPHVVSHVTVSVNSPSRDLP